MKTILTTLIIFISVGKNSGIIKYAYICDSTNAVAYHKTKDCDGLKECTHEIKIVSISEAKTIYNRRACKICYFWNF
jgi:hypothetical protein